MVLCEWKLYFIMEIQGQKKAVYFVFKITYVIPGVQLKSGPYFNISNLFTKIYNMLYYTTNLYLQ
jgi:hypothetical protein